MDGDALFLAPVDAFTEIADTYDARLAGNPTLLLESGAVLSLLPDLSRSGRVADLACGTGRYALQLARLGPAEVIGVDLAPAMLAVAERKARRAELPITWRTGDLNGDLPLADSSLEAAVCALALSFLPDLAPALREIARTLAPGGTLVVSDYHPHGLCAARAASQAVFARDRAPYFRFTSAAGQECRVLQTPHTIADCFAAAQSAGLILERIAEPLTDHRLASTYGQGLNEKIGIPLAVVMRFRKS
ncbi:MAG: class I SAM-dependent methyltransferase [Cytophagales bacterium]|nr:class I SAM-dependent methyltransferase [Armatimonadota bacterium]